ncbi:phospholipase A [Campylobacter sp. RM16189]|uniref:phospholipase A n=1 Tax=Campylobacter sp. RM16189 TaxID=1705726 RepID=UPI0014754DC5|nr:phospholipase A [Campylobacter sp. RM16189]
MKFIYILLFLCINLVASSTQELYDKAADLEKQGDIKGALEYYKLAAKSALDNNNTVKSELGAIAPNNTVVQILENSKETNDKHLWESYESAKPYNLDEILGIKMHHLNYILPASVAFKEVEGRRKFETNFQISLQKPILYNVFDLNETISFGYSQESWWQTAKSSTPFRETNYRPELFITFPTKIPFLQSLDYLRFGLLHESNGQGGEKSRSWNRIYAEAKFYINNLLIIPRAWIRLPDPDGADDNPDIEKYIGKADVTLAYPYKRHMLTAMIRNNLQFDSTNKGSFELGWLFPFGQSGVYGYLKYFSGYGESLIDYDRRRDKIGIGFALVK